MHDQFDLTFSIIIPTYNRAATLSVAIESVLRQTLQDFEVIIVDDGSTDNTKRVIEKYDSPKIRYVYQENSGVTSARNAGASMARGRFITFLDSDDEVENTWLESFHDKLTKRKTGVVFCGCQIKSNFNGKEINIETHPQNLGPTFSNQTAIYYAGAFAVRSDLFRLIGGYDPILTYSENTELLLRLIPACLSAGYRIGSIDRTLITYNKHEKNRTSASPRKLYKSLSHIIARHKDVLMKAPPNFAVFSASAGINAMKIGKYRESLHFLALAVKADPLNWKHGARLFLALIPPIARFVWVWRGKVQEAAS